MMADIRTRIMPLFRRSSAASTASVSSVQSSGGGGGGSTEFAAASVASHHPRNASKTSLTTTKQRRQPQAGSVVPAEREVVPLLSPQISGIQAADTPSVSKHSSNTSASADPVLPQVQDSIQAGQEHPKLTLEEPTPDPKLEITALAGQEVLSEQAPNREFGSTTDTTPTLQRPEGLARQQSLTPNSQRRFIKTLLESEGRSRRVDGQDYSGAGPLALSGSMLHRKIWVKRPGQSATLVTINEEDLVDDVRDMILKKYANSLGRNFDSPDVTLRIVARDHSHHRHAHQERTLGPEEPISRTLDSYYPGGQTVDEALVIDVPQRRTPRHSPRVHIPYYVPEDLRPAESDRDYFPPMPSGGMPSPHLIHAPPFVAGSQSDSGRHHSIAVLNGVQLPPLPSPGSRAGARHTSHRPKFGRQHTSSPTILAGSTSAATSQQQAVAAASIPLDAATLAIRMPHTSAAPVPPPLPTPPLSSSAVLSPPIPLRSATPPPSAIPPRVSSPRPAASKPRSSRTKRAAASSQLPSSLLDTSVPPINVLIVEDNIINLKLLEAFMKRLKVRWHTAMNGRDAVARWRDGGFHLVLMDIQLPIMNGLEATKEIRRLERENGVGLLSGGAGVKSPGIRDARSGSTVGEEAECKEPDAEIKSSDRLANTELFKSPVIIVALTASSLQSDRHEALAAGCNDFLTKPVNFVWLERKVMEWGCMQALIDFDGWRKWKDFSQANTKPASSALKPIKTLSSATPTTAPASSTQMSNSTTASSQVSNAASRPMSPTLATASADMSSFDTASAAEQVKAKRRAKRSSIGPGVLSGVREDSAEGESSGVGV